MSSREYSADELREVLSGMGVKDVVSAARYGSGHINDTFKVDCASGTSYILQRINTDIFDPDAVMSNIRRVTEHIRAKGGKGWLRSFTEPIAIVTPINILEVFIRPLSLCMRLFGNVLGAFVIMELIKMLVPVGVPVVFSLYFDFFDGLIQAYVFVFLTSLFIAEAAEPAAPRPKKAKKKAVQA